MASVEGLSDFELRKKLIEYGFEAPPVTGTTRKLMERKLAAFMSGKGKPTKPATPPPKVSRSLSRFSSAEEDSDDAVNANSRRKSMPAQVAVKRKSLGRSARAAKATVRESQVTDNLLMPSPPPPVSGPAVPAPQVTNNLLLPGPPSSASILGSPPRSDVPDAPYLSAFARRLSQLTPHSLGSAYRNNSYDDVKESDASSDEGSHTSSPLNGHYYRRSFGGQSRVPMRRVDPSRSFKTSEDSVSFWKNSHVMSFVILGGFALFAIFLGMLYLNVTNKDSGNNLVEESSVGNVYNICKNTSSNDIPGVTCVTQDGVAPAMKIFDTVFQNLMNQAIQSECGPASPQGFYPPPYLTVNETVKVVTQQQGLSIWEAEVQVANLVVLLSSNPHWGVAVMDNVVRHPDKTKLQVASPKIPWECLLRNKALELLSSILFILGGFGALYGLWHGIQWWMHARQRHQQEVYHYVERIIEYLSSQHESTGESAYVPVIHVRDQLIPPQSREKLKAVWDAAVSFIDKKESRVRGEIQPVNGEDYKVWRWLPPKHNTSVTGSSAESPSASPHPRHRKKWQGQAFGLSEKSVNNLIVSPTPCLKIRHMFDPDMESGDNWQVQVQDAILEKCANAKILHIHVDKPSKEGCVYVKCASELDAGRAYKALHGSWFDGQLVTVKYLRLERYHERFPLATKAKEPMRPSNNLLLSLPEDEED